jgi:hypothetical protein
MIPLGVHPGFPADEYHRCELGVVSKSALDRVRRSPAHYKLWADGTVPAEETPALSFGRAFHMALLEPERFAKAYASAKKFDRRTTAGKAAYAAWIEEIGDAEPLLFDDMLAITNMVASVRAHPLAGAMICDGEAELTLSWRDMSTGLRCKSRLDYYVRSLAMIVDVKSTEDASREAFRRDIAKYGYHRQDALYRGAALELELPVEHFCLMAVEKSPPHAVATYTLDAEAIGSGYSSVRRDIETLAKCMQEDRWPGYPETIQQIDIPPWAA